MATPKPVRKKMASEGPKRSVAKPTTAQSAAAKKKVAIKKAASEGPKRSVSKPSATAMAIAKSKPKVVEAGVGNIPMTVARAAVAVGKSLKSKTPKAKAAAEYQKQQKNWREVENEMRANKAKVEKELAAIKAKRVAAKKTEKLRAHKELMGRPAPINKPSTAQFKGKRMTDQFGNSGWR